MKELRAIFGLLLAVGVGYLYIYDGQTAHAIKPGGKIALPAPGQQTLGYLFNLINTNNPNKTSNFLIWKDKRWQGAQVIGCNAAWYQQYANTMVTLKNDPNLIESFIQNKQVQPEDKARATKIWLFFELKIGGTTYRFYLNDPNPGKIRIAGRQTIYPARNIMNKYQ